ncbi:unnamed protein product [Medioppia subpectinata]|uniref:Uncharacterized protein n=1 Tax=Medioppia subpectinata TaxID=1979941 RepID=A0A7R9Q3E6_9ACAR|nr:unnamed protein product [Medioppia subpectinata]CAG2111217.1 unnamed protein product [Medioppia subpectinata]
MRTELLAKFSICDNIPRGTRTRIKLLHVFRDFDTEFDALYVTRDDMVYALGANQYGCLGLGHNQRVATPRPVPELCHRSVQYFANGLSAVFAVTASAAATAGHDIYSWGHDMWGQLGRETRPAGLMARWWSGRELYLKPGKVTLCDELWVSQISCGYNHTLVLTIDGHVYGWGDNSAGQIGCGECPVPTGGGNHSVRTPVRVKFTKLFTIKSIYCYGFTTFAITAPEGLVLSWGDNSGRQLGHSDIGAVNVCKPRLVSKVADIRAVYCAYDTTYFLANSGAVYLCNQLSRTIVEMIPVPQVAHRVFEQLPRLHSFVDTYDKFVPVLSDGKVCKYDCNLIETNYGCFADFYANEYRITYNTLDLMPDYDRNSCVFINKWYENIYHHLIYVLAEQAIREASGQYFN